jgi:predicted metal-dependent peptidase
MNIKSMIAEIYRSGDFLLGSILSTARQISTKQIPTAAVGLCPSKRNICLYYNDDFMESLSKEECLDVLRHEAMHVAQCHLTRIGDRNPKRWNVACDMNINQFLPNLPDDCIKLRLGFPPKKSSDVYFDLVGKEEEEHWCDMEFDPHGMWREIQEDSAISRKIESDTEGKVRIAAAAGDQTARALLTLFAAPPTKRWVSDIRKMFEPSKPEVSYKSNRFDRRRTYPNGDEMIPARITRPEKPKVFVAIDTSASITEEQISKFLGEIDKMSDCAEIIALIFDTEIHQEIKWKKIGDRSIDIEGRGGTDFQPLFDRVCQESQDRNLIILTDGYAAEPVPSKKTKTLWALTAGSSGDFSFDGYKTRLQF